MMSLSACVCMLSSRSALTKIVNPASLEVVHAGRRLLCAPKRAFLRLKIRTSRSFIVRNRWPRVAVLTRTGRLDSGRNRLNLTLMTFPRPHVRGYARALILGLLLLIWVIFRADAARTELDLGGTWQYQNVSQLSYPPSNNWQTITVPGFLSGYQYQHAWFRTTFALPSTVAGTQLKLKFGGVKYNAQVWLNGTFIGNYLNGYEAFAFDITAASLVGQTNELIVGVTDWTATFAQPVNFSNQPAGEDARYFVTNNILAPIGGRYELY